jgi:hypothetical protein
MTEPIIEDGFFRLTVRLPDGQEIAKELDLFEQFNTLNGLSRSGDAVAVNEAMAKHFQQVFSLERKPSHRCAIRLAEAIYAEVQTEKNVPAREATPVSRDSTAAAPSPSPAG